MSYYGSRTAGGPYRTVSSPNRRSSSIVREEYLDTAGTAALKSARGGIKYVEVPVVEEVIKRVPKREIIEVEKYVPKYEYEVVDKMVEVPQVQWVERHVEIPQYQEVIREVRRKEIIDVPREYVRQVPKVETVVVEKRVEVPGEIIEVPKHYKVENAVPVRHYVDNEVPMVVAQTIRPYVTESDEVVEVDVYEYEPEFITVDVEVPKAVPLPILDYGITEEAHRVVQVPPAQYNTMLRMLNSHISEVEHTEALPFIQENHRVPFLSGLEANMMYPAPKTTHIEGWTPRVPYSERDRSRTARNNNNRHRYSRRPIDYYSYYPSVRNNNRNYYDNNGEGFYYDDMDEYYYDPMYEEAMYYDDEYYPYVRQRDPSKKKRSKAKAKSHTATSLADPKSPCKCCT